MEKNKNKQQQHTNKKKSNESHEKLKNLHAFTLILK